jgi:hypothetical protein
MPAICTSFPHPITEIENTFITLIDGTRLAARIWLPVDADSNPVPAILEYLPYRKNDGTIVRDSKQMPYLAGHGYACVRVDMRGSGDSDGILYDEYLQQEQDDAIEVIDWIASQKWCDGNVGMWGISWGGFNALQVAARRPPALKAIITLCSTDDRYADDVHYMGGCVLGADMPGWASTMLALNALPPDPRFRPDWREVWFDRLEKTPPYLEAWLAHQRRDSFWEHGSVCEDYSAINIPVFAVGGWADAYTNAVFRLLEGLNVPRLGLIGPWAHLYPEFAVPGPQIGFLQEALRWWDHWLKNKDTGIMNEPLLRVYIQNATSPQIYFEERPGHWASLDSWPSPIVIQCRYHLTSAGLATEPGPLTPPVIATPPHCGRQAGVWCPYGHPGDYPLDQRPDDALSVTFDSPILQSPISILGFPELTLILASDKPDALLAARLCDLAPDGTSALITWSLLNLTHHTSHANPQSLIPNLQFSISLKLNAIAYTLPSGHRLRLALSNAYWPHAWPSPEPATLTLHSGHFDLPLYGQVSDLPLPIHWTQPEIASPLPTHTLRPESRARTIQHDTITGRHTLRDEEDTGLVEYLPTGLQRRHRTTCTHSLTDGYPLSAKAQCQHDLFIGRGDWQIRILTDSVLTSDAEYFHQTNVLEAYEGNVRVFAKTRAFRVKRDMV